MRDRLRLPAPPVLPRLALRLPLLDRPRARQHGAAHAPAPLRRRLGPGHPGASSSPGIVGQAPPSSVTHVPAQPVTYVVAFNTLSKAREKEQSGPRERLPLSHPHFGTASSEALRKAAKACAAEHVILVIMTWPI